MNSPDSLSQGLELPVVLADVVSVLPVVFGVSLPPRRLPPMSGLEVGVAGTLALAVASLVVVVAVVSISILTHGVGVVVLTE